MSTLAIMRTVLITGANSGMGYQTALALAKEPVKLILGIRDRSAAVGTISALKKISNKNQVISIPLDLSSFASVESFAAQVSNHTNHLEVLLLNAGIMCPPYGITEDGFETQFQVNYLSHFLLFDLLKEMLLHTNEKKLISISSDSSEKGTCNTLDAFMKISCPQKQAYNPLQSYRESKLAQVLFSLEAQHRFGGKGLNAFAVHPGVVNTRLFYNGRPWWYKYLVAPFAWIGYATGKLTTPAKGAATAIYLANSKNIEGGKYWADLQPRPHNPIADDLALRAELWEWSLQQVRSYA